MLIAGTRRMSQRAVGLRTVSLLLLPLLLLHASAKAPPPAPFQQHASLFGPEYEVQLMAGVIYPPGGGPEQHRLPSTVMTKKSGKQYRCYLPRSSNVSEPVQPPIPSLQQLGSLLRPLTDSCFYRLEGWWTYELCFMKSMRQFHQEKIQSTAGVDSAREETRVTQDYQLGLYWLPERQRHASDATPNAEAPAFDAADFRGELGYDLKTNRRYFAQKYGNGSRCDITGNPREVELRVWCEPSEPTHIVGIEEISTCHYVVQFRTNLLCKHPAFMHDQKTEDVKSVQCESLKPVESSKEQAGEFLDLNHLKSGSLQLEVV